MEDHNNIPLGLNVPAQIPLDVKLYINSESALSNLGLGDQLAYTYTKGIVIFCINEATRWEWKEVSAGLEDTGLINNDFIYPSGHVAFNIDYSNKRYNFFKVLNDGSDTIIEAGDNIEIEGKGTINEPYSIKSTYIYTPKSIVTTTLDITEDENNIYIDTPAISSSSIKTFYVNSTFVPTIDSPSEGSIIRPFINFDDAKAAYIGTGTIIEPQYIGATIILQTSSTTSQNPTVNELTIRFENESFLTYSGTDAYMFDTEILYPLIPKNITRNDLTIRIRVSLTGDGGLIRTEGIGLVRSQGSNRNGLGIASDNSSIIYVGKSKEDIIRLYERTEYSLGVYSGDVTNSLGVTLESIYGVPFKYSLILAPTTPLIYVKYNSSTPSNHPLYLTGTTLIKTVANTALMVDDTEAKVIGDTITLTLEPTLVPTVSATKMSPEYPNHYQPFSNRHFIESKGDVLIKNILIEESAGFGVTGLDSFFNFKNNGSFYSGSLNISTNIYINKFINISDATNTNDYFNLSNDAKGSTLNIPYGRYFVDTTFSSWFITMPKSTVSGFLNRSTSVVNISPSTNGTISSLMGKPVISGVVTYANEAAAIADGATINTLFYNSSLPGLDIL